MAGSVYIWLLTNCGGDGWGQRCAGIGSGVCVKFVYSQKIAKIKRRFYVDRHQRKPRNTFYPTFGTVIFTWCVFYDRCDGSLWERKEVQLIVSTFELFYILPTSWIKPVQHDSTADHILTFRELRGPVGKLKSTRIEWGRICGSRLLSLRAHNLCNQGSAPDWVRQTNESILGIWFINSHSNIYSLGKHKVYK